MNAPSDTHATNFRVSPSSLSVSSIFTPHAQRERGKVIDRGVHILYIYIYSIIIITRARKRAG